MATSPSLNQRYVRHDCNPGEYKNRNHQNHSAHLQLGLIELAPVYPQSLSEESSGRAGHLARQRLKQSTPLILAETRGTRRILSSLSSHFEPSRANSFGSDRLPINKQYTRSVRRSSALMQVFRWSSKLSELETKASSRGGVGSAEGTLVSFFSLRAFARQLNRLRSPANQ